MLLKKHPLILLYFIYISISASDIITRFYIVKDACEVITREGYPAESHTIETKDGYILNLQRIPYSRKTRHLKKRFPILLMHGLMASSLYYLNYGPEKSLAFFLADHDFDVWLGNARGTFHGRKHKTKIPNNQDFWDFSWHEIGVYDLPAMIDYILDKTKHENLIYIGHSQGTTAFFVLCSERPEYNSKIRTMIALSPSAYIHENFKNSFLIRHIKTVEKMANMFGITKFAAEESTLILLFRRFCKSFTDFCLDLLHLSTGFVTSELNITLFNTVFTSFPGGNSLKQFYHYAQIIQSIKFCKYDYGIEGNLIKYQNIYPPEYNLTHVTTPVSLFFGDNDQAVHHEDVKRLIAKLPNIYHQQKINKFNHLDFLWAYNIHNRLYFDILRVLSLK